MFPLLSQNYYDIIRALDVKTEKSNFKHCKGKKAQSQKSRSNRRK